MEGEALKWQGHCHNRLGAPQASEEAFQQGATLAQQVSVQALKFEILKVYNFISIHQQP